MTCRTIKVEGTYNAPPKNVLVLGCIDLRLTDETVSFLHQDNLHNRFDYFTLAGASLCTHEKQFAQDFKSTVLKRNGNFKHWCKTLIDHVQSAIALHQIQDIYIVEHRDCGAYKVYLENGEFGPGKEYEELEAHKKYATALAKKLEKYKTKYLEDGKIKSKNLKVHAFLIDLRGDVQLLYPKKDTKKL